MAVRPREDHRHTSVGENRGSMPPTITAPAGAALPSRCHGQRRRQQTQACQHGRHDHWSQAQRGAIDGLLHDRFSDWDRRFDVRIRITPVLMAMPNNDRKPIPRRRDYVRWVMCSAGSSADGGKRRTFSTTISASLKLTPQKQESQGWSSTITISLALGDLHPLNWPSHSDGSLRAVLRCCPPHAAPVHGAAQVTAAQCQT